MARKFLTTKQAGRWLNRSPATISRLASAGALRGATLGRKGWIIPTAAVKAQVLRRKLPAVVAPDRVVHCQALHCTLTAGACVKRQIKTEAQHPKHLQHGQAVYRRGVAGDHPTCDSTTCAQGAAIRDQLDPRSGVRWSGVGNKHRFERVQRDVFKQYAAARALAVVGLLDIVPTCDGALVLEEEVA